MVTLDKSTRPAEQYRVTRQTPHVDLIGNHLTHKEKENPKGHYLETK